MNVRDNFREYGIDYADFQAANDLVAADTKLVQAKGQEIRVLSLNENPDVQVPGKIVFDVIDAVTLNEYEKGTKPVPYVRGAMNSNLINEELLKELQNTTKLMLIIDDDRYIVSEIAMKTLALQASLGGDLMMSRNNLIRNIHLADCLVAKNAPIRFVYREGQLEDGTPVKKIFAALGGTFKLVPQTVMQEIKDVVADDMGECSVSGWDIDQAFTRLRIKFPELGKQFKEELGTAITPGVEIVNSDIGASSVTVRGTYSTEKSYVYTDEVAFKHTDNLDIEKVLEAAKKRIFEQFKELPELLAKLIGQQVADYSDLDLTTKAGQDKNETAVFDAYEFVLEKVGKLAGNNFPKKQRNLILECLKDEINGEIQYTYYDIAMTIMDLPERLKGLNDQSMIEIRRACAKAPKAVEEYIQSLGLYLAA